jgi:hypothetical protein
MVLTFGSTVGIQLDAADGAYELRPDGAEEVQAVMPAVGARPTAMPPGATGAIFKGEQRFCTCRQFATSFCG